MSWNSTKTALLNSMNRVAQKIDLGTEIAALSASVAGGTLASGKLLVGSAGAVATARTISGAIAISNAGVASIAVDSIINADIKSDAAIAFSKLAALASAYILVGSVANVATAVAVSGDATISNAGAVTVSKIANKTVSHVPILGGLSASESDADATVTITDAAIAATDVIIATLRAAANAVYVTKAVCGVGSATITLSGNGGAGTIVNYLILRAA